MPKAKTAAEEARRASLDDLDTFYVTEEELEMLSKELESDGDLESPPGSIPVYPSTTPTTSSTSTSTSSKKGTETMNMFKVGDFVVGKEAPENGYYILDKHSISEVVDVSSEGIMSVKLRYTDNPILSPKKYVNEVYKDVAMAAMRPATAEEITKAKMGAAAASAKTKGEKAEISVIFRTGLSIKRFPSGSIQSSFNKLRDLSPEIDDNRITALNAILDYCKDRKADSLKSMRTSEITSIPGVGKTFDNIFGDKYIKTCLDNMINFFREFQFEPNFRFINTLALISGTEGLKPATDYVNNYFTLTNHAFATSIADKITSPEFKEMVFALGTKDCSTPINKRFKVYYGSQGTGKTTKAMVETSGRCIVCNNSMLPQDLMEDFTFDDGKPGFHPSVLAECMQKGQGITLDEINLLPFETIRFLQGIVDGKKEFIWKGHNIKIKDGFNIIGTMNLVVNGMAFGLPEPLVDRCSRIEKSQLTADNLMGCLD